MIFLNPSYDPSRTFEGEDFLPLQFHKKLPFYRRTPLHTLQPLADRLGIARLYVKDESSRLGLPAFKILGASWAAYRVLCDRFPELQEAWSSVDELADRLSANPFLTLYSATDGNHGRAVSRVAALLGLHARIYVPKGTTKARIAAIENEGASVHIVDGTYDDTVATAARDANTPDGLLIQDNGWSGYEKIPRYVIEGYSTLLHEIDETIAEWNEAPPTHVLVQIGVGSFAEAVVRHYRKSGSSTRVIAVEPETAACALESVKAGRIVKVPGPHQSIMAGMNCDTPSLVSFPVLQKGVHSFVAITDQRAKEAMRLLAQYGIVSGETGAAGLGGLFELLSDKSRLVTDLLDMNRQSRILVISTEGATDPLSYRSIVGSDG